MNMIKDYYNSIALVINPKFFLTCLRINSNRNSFPLLNTSIQHSPSLGRNFLNGMFFSY